MDYQPLNNDAKKAYEDSIGVIWAEAQQQLNLSNDNLVLSDLVSENDIVSTININDSEVLKRYNEEQSMGKYWYLDRKFDLE